MYIEQDYNTETFMNRFLQYFLAFIIVGVCIYVFGPVVKFEKVDNDIAEMNLSIDNVQDFIDTKESETRDIKPLNQAHILWADSIRQTDYSIVYLHGFTASHREGYPIIQHLAYRYQCNAFLSRLACHGLEDEDAFLSLTPKKYIESAKEAIEIGKALGKKVILVSTSTGSTLSIYLAANDPSIAGLVMLSPNIELYDPMSKLITKPWGKELMRLINNGDYLYWNNAPDYVQRYWSTKNHINGVIALRNMLDQTMTQEVFKQIDIPYFIAYYYKDEDNQDKTISVDAIHRYSELSSTPKDKKIVRGFDNAIGHVIGCYSLNPAWEDIQEAIFAFVEEQMNINSKVGRQ
ncbi:MAG: alpha/beta hydrolase [Bacteroidia bacterium]|nr:alpha/beta hydrolase [Bacteroidia bacterium]